MDEIKKEIERILENNLGVARDNFHRANICFGNMPQAQLNEQYGQSGKTCLEIFQEYQNSLRKAEDCFKWIKSH